MQIKPSHILKLIKTDKRPDSSCGQKWQSGFEPCNLHDLGIFVKKLQQKMQVLFSSLIFECLQRRNPQVTEDAAFLKNS